MNGERIKDSVLAPQTLSYAKRGENKREEEHFMSDEDVTFHSCALAHFKDLINMSSSPINFFTKNYRISKCKIGRRKIIITRKATIGQTLHI